MRTPKQFFRDRKAAREKKEFNRSYDYASGRLLRDISNRDKIEEEIGSFLEFRDVAESGMLKAIQDYNELNRKDIFQIHAESEFESKLCSLLNTYAAEGGSNTPDHILAKYLLQSLEIFDKTVASREDWYGRPPVPPRTL